MKYSIFLQHAKAIAEERKESFEDALKWIRASGVEFIQGDLDEFGDPAEMLPVFEAADIKPADMYHVYQFASDPDAVEDFRHLDKAEAYGLKVFMPIPGLYSSDKKDPKELENMISGMKKICAEAGKRGITPMMESYDHFLSPIASIEGIKKFKEAIPNLKIIFDTGNVYFAGDDLKDFYPAFGEDIIYMHLKDRALTDNGGEAKTDFSGRTVYTCAVGSGVVPIKDAVLEMQAHGFNGHAVLEFFGAADYSKALVDSMRYINEQFN